MTLPVPVPPAPPTASGALERSVDRARAYAAQARAANTARAYRAAWDAFVGWCAARALDPWANDPAAVALFLADEAAAGRKMSTLRLRLAAIAANHRAIGTPLDTRDARLRAVLAGVARVHGSRPRQAAPLRPAQLRDMVAALPGTPAGARDRALLLLGFAAALRRSELVALERADVRRDERGLLLLIRASKTDQGGEGQEVAVPKGRSAATCPVAALDAWLAVRGDGPGPLLRAVSKAGRVLERGLHPGTVADVVKAAAWRIGLDPALLSGHSLRAGLATAAAAQGAQLHQIMKQTRHKSADVARTYIREAELWQDNVAGLVL
ncbi:tyrosine-type recombinase/integrase [Azospirillum canadense]|uniref:tyrosine-type recombinase/integrase n=1 Tax=Azospirillum canadense TaxID=403962 RepID=UPI0022267E7F|nr:tyrosine-type recombinase/integrase [Azospirillum canadense]MCW2242289.1 integrase [Azospirillum canadense]